MQAVFDEFDIKWLIFDRIQIMAYTHCFILKLFNEWGGGVNIFVRRNVFKKYSIAKKQKKQNKKKQKKKKQQKIFVLIFFFSFKTFGCFQNNLKTIYTVCVHTSTQGHFSMLVAQGICTFSESEHQSVPNSDRITPSLVAYI